MKRLTFRNREEKHKLLSIMLEAVYVDLAASRSIVGIQPKPVFYPLFNSLENQSGNAISVFHDKKTEPNISGSGTVMVETGESRLLAICSTHLLSALLVVLACNTATVNVWAGQAHKLAYCSP